MQNTKTYIIFEFIFLFICLPLAIFLYPYHLPKIPVLLAVTVYAAIILRSDKSFDLKSLWNFRALKNSAPVLFIRITILLLLMVIYVVLFEQKNLLNFPENRFYSWLTVMLFYPFFSALPQEVIYRTFFFHRYKKILKNKFGIIAASALCFSFLHIIYYNWLAVLFSLCGGIIFSYSYAENKSTAAVTLEHSVYGDALFTLGLGSFFYN